MFIANITITADVEESGEGSKKVGKYALKAGEMPVSLAGERIV
jgi:hypothetical protein